MPIEAVLSAIGKKTFRVATRDITSSQQARIGGFRAQCVSADGADPEQLRAAALAHWIQRLAVVPEVFTIVTPLQIWFFYSPETPIGRAIPRSLSGRICLHSTIRIPGYPA